jgi:alkylhydroperoxidase/carboxymuconolactone decarboxylase family protein YurZ
MNLSEKQNKLYSEFYNSTCKGEVLDSKVESLVGLSAAIAMNCKPCTSFYIKQCKSNGASDCEIQAVLAKVMAVSAGQKALQFKEAQSLVGSDGACGS